MLHYKVELRDGNFDLFLRKDGTFSTISLQTILKNEYVLEVTYRFDFDELVVERAKGNLECYDLHEFLTSLELDEDSASKGLPTELVRDDLRFDDVDDLFISLYRDAYSIDSRTVKAWEY